ncbi:MAG: AAA family ATPase [Gammaproteobacteria bacterium]|nr:AAA family ATPase [Gammaproteobacteria bacterium]
METLRLTLLGHPTFSLDEEQITNFRYSKAQALLCYLAVTGRTHARSALVGLLWGNLPEAKARTNLRRILTTLRRRVDSHLLITRQTVAFNQDSPYWLDVAEFEARVGNAATESDITRLSEGIALYQGDFLEGFYVTKAPEFEEWLLAEQGRLRELALQGLHTLATHFTEQGHLIQGIDYTRRLLALESWREEAHRQLMLLLARSGQRGAALSQYETCRQVLEDELGVEPSEETMALYQRIREGNLNAVLENTNESFFGTRRNGLILSSEARPSVPLPAFLDDDTAPDPPIVFVTRTRELAALETTLSTAQAGEGQILFVIGGAGRGKSTLVQEFARRAQAADNELIVISGYCNAHTGLGDPYLPFREALTMLTGDVEAKWAGGLISQKHARRLWQTMPITVPALVQHGPNLVGSLVPGHTLRERAATFASDDVPWFKQLANITTDHQTANLEQQLLFTQVTAALKAITLQRSVLLIVEDLHWVDNASSALLFHLSRQVSDSRILIIGTYRPEEVAVSWSRQRHPLAGLVSELKRQHGDIWLDLADMDRIEGRQFVDAYLDAQPNRLGAEFREALFQRTEGHALFTVELLREMQELGYIGYDEAGYWVETNDIDWQTMPARVEGVIETRINRLEEDLQSVLTVASVEGEMFTAEVVARVQQVNERTLVEQLSRELDKRHRLVTAQSLEMRQEQRLSRYRFRHQLFQHYLYHSLDEIQRTYLHEEVGNALEHLYEGQTDEVAVQLARHFEIAGSVLKAVDYLQQAGERASRMSAHEEVIEHFNQALDLLETLPNPSKYAKEELSLQLALARAIYAAKGTSAPEIESVYIRARMLCQQVGEGVQLIQVLWGLSSYNLVRGDVRTARDLAEQCLDVAQDLQMSKLLVGAHQILGTGLLHMGELVAGLTHLKQGTALYTPQKHYDLISFYGQDVGVQCQRYEAWGKWILGYPDQALEQMYRTLSLANELAHPLSVAGAQAFACVLHYYRREVQAVEELAEAAITYATEHRLLLWKLFGLTFQGWCLVEQGQREAGIDQIRRGLDDWQATGAWADPLLVVLLVEAHLRMGQAAEGLIVLEQQLRVVDDNDMRSWEAELYRLKGELLLLQGVDDRKIERQYLKAIDIARQQSAKSLELRAAISLCRLWQHQGKNEEARQMLAAIYDWFSEGFDTADLIEAKSLLGGGVK